MSKQIKNIFSDSACPSQEMMLKYASNLLKGEEKHGIERHLAGCAFCSDALEGLSLLENKEVSGDISSLHRKIDNISTARRKAGYWPLAVAASVSILLVCGTWFYLQNNKMEQVASETAIKNEVKMTEPLTDTSEKSIKKNSEGGYKDQKQVGVQAYQWKMNSSVSEGVAPSSPPVSSNNMPSPVQEDIAYNQSEGKMDEVMEMNDLNKSEEKEVVVIGYGTMRSADMRKPANNSDSVLPPAFFRKNNISQQMLAMVENEFINNSSQVPHAAAEKKSKSRQQAPSSKKEADKDKILDDCPNCPKKSVSETAQSNLVVLSMDYALKKYQMKEYELAHKQFEEIIKEDDDPGQTKKAKIFNALSLVKLNRGAEALDIVNNIISTPSGQTMDVAKWVKASILISMKENVKAKVILEDLSNHVNPYQARAKEVLANLQ